MDLNLIVLDYVFLVTVKPLKKIYVKNVMKDGDLSDPLAQEETVYNLIRLMDNVFDADQIKD